MYVANPGCAPNATPVITSSDGIGSDGKHSKTNYLFVGSCANRCKTSCL